MKIFRYKHTFLKACHTNSQKERLTDTSNIYLWSSSVCTMPWKPKASIKFIDPTISYSYAKLG